MATGMMYECEQKKEFQVGGKIERRWVKVSAELIDVVPKELLRCLHCHGPVRLHKQRVAHGPRDHVEHTVTADRTHCKGGNLFKSGAQHRMSLMAVP